MEDMFTEIPKIEMEFNEKEIQFKEFRTYNVYERHLSPAFLKAWENRIEGEPYFFAINSY
jgi:hypothetical protein